MDDILEELYPDIEDLELPNADLEPIQALPDPQQSYISLIPRDILAIILSYARGAATNRVCRTWRIIAMGPRSIIYYDICDFAKSPESVLWYEKESGKIMTDVCYYAARIGSLETLQWARNNNYPWNHRVCNAAAARGDLPMLRWAWSETAQMDESAFDKAAGHGHKHILEWMRSATPDMKQSLNTWKCMAKYNQLEMAKHMYESYDLGFGLGDWVSVCEKAASANSMDFLQWLLNMDLGIVTESVLIHAAEWGHADFVMKHLGNIMRFRLTSMIDLLMSAANRKGDALIKALYKLEGAWPSDMSDLAAKIGNLPLLKYVTRDCVIDRPDKPPCHITLKTLINAIDSNSVEMVDWLLSGSKELHGHKIWFYQPDFSYRSADNIPMMKILAKHGILPNVDTLTTAIQEDNLASVKWLREGCVRDGSMKKPVPWTEKMFPLALSKGPLMYRWLIEHGCPISSGPACIMAECMGKPDAAQLIKKLRGCSWENEQSFINVVRDYGESAVRKALEYGHVLSTTEFVETFLLSKRSEPFRQFVQDNLVPHYFPTIKNMQLVLVLCSFIKHSGSDPDEFCDVDSDSSDPDDD